MLASNIQHSASAVHICVHIYVPFQVIFHSRASSIVPWALQYVSTVYLFRVHVNPLAYPFPFGNDESAFYVCESVSILLISSFMSYSRSTYN